MESSSLLSAQFKAAGENNCLSYEDWLSFARTRLSAWSDGRYTREDKDVICAEFIGLMEEESNSGAQTTYLLEAVIAVGYEQDPKNFIRTDALFTKDVLKYYIKHHEKDNLKELAELSVDQRFAQIKSQGKTFTSPETEQLFSLLITKAKAFDAARLNEAEKVQATNLPASLMSCVFAPILFEAEESVVYAINLSQSVSYKGSKSTFEKLAKDNNYPALFTDYSSGGFGSSRHYVNQSNVLIEQLVNLNDSNIVQVYDQMVGQYNALWHKGVRPAGSTFMSRLHFTLTGLTAKVSAKKQANLGLVSSLGSMQGGGKVSREFFNKCLPAESSDKETNTSSDALSNNKAGIFELPNGNSRLGSVARRNSDSGSDSDNESVSSIASNL